MNQVMKLLLASLLLQLSTALSIISPNSSSVINYESGFDVTWNKDNSNPITIWLYSGYGAGIKQINTVVSNFQNDGTYVWTVVASNAFSSGCNYALLMTDGTSRTWSQYFTINNQQDGGLPLNSNCTSLAANPQTPTVPASAATSTGTGTGTSSTASSTSTSFANSNSNSNSNSNGGSNGSSNDNNGGSTSKISITVFGAVIAALAVGLIGVFACILCCLRAKGYLRKHPTSSYPPPSTDWTQSPPVQPPVQQQTYAYSSLGNGAYGARDNGTMDGYQANKFPQTAAYPQSNELDGEPHYAAQLPSSAAER